MTLEQRAQQVWSVLVFAAREQKVISYGMLSKMTGIPNTSGNILYHIYAYCNQNNIPLLNMIVINQMGRPGDDCPPAHSDLSIEQARVFVYDWLSHGAPSDQMFKDAVQREKAQKAAKSATTAD